jgi:RNA-directed DNA polymerase
LLLNIVLHGMETAAGVRYRTRQGGRVETAYDCPVLVRYADDLTAFCHSRQQAEQVTQQLAEWLKPRGLAFNEDKTRIVHVALLTELTTAFGQAVDGAARVPASLSA